MMALVLAPCVGGCRHAKPAVLGIGTQKFTSSTSPTTTKPDFDKEIKRNIRSCSLFLPVISATTQSRHEAYFRLEWSLAAERAKLIAETIPFILPVVIDPVNEGAALVPERFLQVQWTRLPGGTPTPEFVERMVRLIRDFRKRERGLL